MSRPYEANYAIGFMFVLGVCLLFYSMCAWTYPDMKAVKEAEGTLYLFIVLSVIVLALSTMLLFGMPVAYKAALAFIPAMLAAELLFMLDEGIYTFNILVILTTVCSIALLTAKKCREFYRGWGTEIRFYDRSLAIPDADVLCDTYPMFRDASVASLHIAGTAPTANAEPLSGAVPYTFGHPSEPVKYPPWIGRNMKCPVCGRDSGLNPFSICQYCGNALTSDISEREMYFPRSAPEKKERQKQRRMRRQPAATDKSARK